MVRWRFALLLAMLMLTHMSYSEDTEDENPEPEEDESDEKDEDDEDATEKFANAGRRAPMSTLASKATRTAKKRPLECYICKYSKDLPLLSCMDPENFNVHTDTCHNPNEKCFTAVERKEPEIVSVTRGCRSNCVGTPDVTCCETNRCNDHQFSQPIAYEIHQVASKSSKSIHHSILYFVTILLLLQTVVKVKIL